MRIGQTNQIREDDFRIGGEVILFQIDFVNHGKLGVRATHDIIETVELLLEGAVGHVAAAVHIRGEVGLCDRFGEVTVLDLNK